MKNFGAVLFVAKRATLCLSLFVRIEELESVWFVANCATLYLRLVVRIEKLTLDRKVR
jgi:hypothetical protein